jgi:hypothetical protein
MFITNFEYLNNTFSFTAMLGEYLEKHGFPVLGKQEDKYIFAKTDKLQEALIKLPFYLRPFAKGGG